MGHVITYVIAWLQGIVLGWVCGLVVGSAVWYFRAKRQYDSALILSVLDTETDWDTEDADN